MDNTRRNLCMDPGTLIAGWAAREIEIVVPYTDRAATRAVLARAAGLTAGLNARIALVAVHTVPYPSDFECPASVHAFLVQELVDLAAGCPLPVSAQVVLARSRDDGFRHVLKAESMVLIGTRRHAWRTAEERLARCLASSGHSVALLHVE
jgi:hypothetical protein